MALATGHFTFAPGISCCEVEGQLILLDQQADRYLALKAEQEQSLKHLLAGTARTTGDDKCIGELAKFGILMEASGGPAPKLCEHRLPVIAHISSSKAEVAAFTQLRFALRVVIARRLLRWRGLSVSLHRFRQRKASLSSPCIDPGPALQEAANLLRRITLFTTSHDQCLPIALGLAHHLLDRRVPSEVVLGVQLGPFQAHCWLQHGEHLIGDDLDIIRTFKPILVI